MIYADANPVQRGVYQASREVMVEASWNIPSETAIPRVYGHARISYVSYGYELRDISLSLRFQVPMSCYLQPTLAIFQGF